MHDGRHSYVYLNSCIDIQTLWSFLLSVAVIVPLAKTHACTVHVQYMRMHAYEIYT